MHRAEDLIEGVPENEPGIELPVPALVRSGAGIKPAEVLQRVRAQNNKKSAFLVRYRDSLVDGMQVHIAVNDYIPCKGLIGPDSIIHDMRDSKRGSEQTGI